MVPRDGDFAGDGDVAGVFPGVLSAMVSGPRLWCYLKVRCIGILSWESSEI